MTDSINKEMIDELKDLMEEDFPLLIETYITDSDKRLLDLSLAVTESNDKQLREIAHGLKGSSSNLGANKLAEICHELETMGNNKQLDGAEEKLNELNEEYVVVNSYFTNLL